MQTPLRSLSAPATLLAGLAIFLPSSQAFSDETTERRSFRTYGAEYFQWDETVDRAPAERDFVSESGPLFHSGYTHGTDWTTGEGFYFRASHDNTLGVVSYRGEPIEYPDIKIDGHSLYAGYEYSRQIGYRVRLRNNLTLSPALGLGLSAWSRTILSDKYENPETGEDERAGAYEVYLVPYATAGLQIAYWMKGGSRLSLSAGKKRPFVVYEYSKDARGMLKPKPSWADTASLEFSTSGDAAKIFGIRYEDTEFGKSETNKHGWYQPGIETSSVSIFFGISI